MKKYFYEVEFHDGRYFYRKDQTKKMAQSAYDTFVAEFTTLNVKSVSWGIWCRP